MTATLSPTQATGLIDYLATEAYRAVVDREIFPGEIHSEWIEQAVRWSFTWQEEFAKLNAAERAAIAEDVKCNVETWLSEDEEVCYPVY